MCNFKIGQEVVAIKDHIKGRFKKGQIFQIEGLQASKCSCGHVLLNIGLPRIYTHSGCKVCNYVYHNDSSYMWFNYSNFAPLQTDSEEADMNEALAEIAERKLFSI